MLMVCVRYKKNLKALYVVHPTTFIRVIWNLFRPFIRYNVSNCRLRHCVVTVDNLFFLLFLLFLFHFVT